MPSIKRPLAARPNGSLAFKEALGAYMQGLREKAGMTQAQLAQALGFTYPSAISAIEVGRNTVPPERYLQFAEVLGVEPKVFGEEVLRLTDPWMHAILFASNPKKATEHVNELMNTRFGVPKSLARA